MPFDARAAKLLQPGEHLKVDECPGLRLEATASTRTWTYRYKSRVDERMRQVKIGLWPAISHGAAVGDWAALKAERDAGRDPAQEKRAARAEAQVVAEEAEGYSVRQCIADYLHEHVDQVRKARGAKVMRQMLESKTEKIADLQVVDVTRSIAFELLQAFKKIPVTAGTLRGELGAAWDHALDAGRVPEETPNWWRQIMRGKLRSKGKTRARQNIGVDKRALLEAEAGRLILWLPNFSNLVEDALLMYFWTLTRGSEILSIEGREVSDEEDGLWWTIPKPKTKNARHELATDLRVPLVGRAETVVRRRMALYGKGWLFPSVTKKGKPTHTNQAVIGSSVYNHQPYATTRETRYVNKLTVTNWAPHDLRRTGRTMLASMGCPEEVAEALLGHMPKGIVGVYNRHRYDRERRDWLTKLSVRLEELAARATP